MKTDELVSALAADAKSVGHQFSKVAFTGIIVAVVLTAALFFSLLGLRTDFVSALGSTRFVFKLFVVILLALTATAMLVRAGIPDALLSPWIPVSIFTLALVGAVVELAALPSSTWLSNLRGTNALFCVTVIPALSFIPLAIAIAVLRYGAPTQPARAGAVAGLVASGIGASFYALNCDNDSPLFLAAWYGLAIGIVVLSGRFAGSRLLKW